MLKDGMGSHLKHIVDLGLNVGNTFNEIMNWAMKTEANKSHGKQAALLVKSDRDTRDRAAGQRCFRCRRVGHFIWECRERSPENQREPQKCSNCQRTDHTKTKCWAPGGGMEGMGPQRGQSGKQTGGKGGPIIQMTAEELQKFLSQ